MKTIICKICGETKPHEAFGLCRNCYMQEDWNPKNRDKRRAYRLKHRDGECAHKKEYRLKNRDRIAAHQKELYRNGTSDTIRIQRDKSGKQYWYFGNGKAVHRVIAEELLDRKLTSNECVHHIDGNGLNNADENLLICTRSYHTYLHRQMERRSHETH